MGSGTTPHPPGLVPLYAVALICAGLVLFACSGKDEAARIREWVRGGTALAERHDLNGLLARTTGEFRASPGDRDREGVRDVLAAAFYHYRRFHILYPYPAVELAEDGRSATIAMPFLLVRKDGEFPDLEALADDPQGWLARVGDRADLYHLELELVKREGEWLAGSAQLRGAGGGTR